MEWQVTDMEQEVIITNNNLPLHFSGHKNDLLVLKQWKGALNRIMPSLLGLLTNNDRARSTRSFFLRRARSSGIIIYGYFEKGCRKNVHATIPKGNMGYDQYTVPDIPDTVAVENTVVAFL